MALSSTGFRDALKTKMDALPDGADSDAIYLALAEAWVEYFTANAEVSVTVPDVVEGTDTASGTGTIA